MNYFFIPKDYSSDLFENVIANYTYPYIYEAGRENKNIFFYAAADDNEIVGLAVIEIIGQIARLCSIAVDEERRRRKIASSMINGICRELKKTNVCWLETRIVNYGEQVAIEESFIKSMYFEPISDEGSIATVLLKDCVDNEILKHYLNKYENPCSYKELEETEIRLFDKKLKCEGIYRNLTDDSVSREYSFFYRFSEEITGCLLISDEGDELNIDFAYVDSDNEDKMVLLKLIGAADIEASRHKNLNTVIRVSCINGVSARLFTKLFPDCADVKRVKKYIRAI